MWTPTTFTTETTKTTEEAGSEPFTSVFGDGELLFEGVEFITWKRPIVDISNCTCLTLGCARPWLVQLRRANECMVVMPAFDELKEDPIAGPRSSPTSAAFFCCHPASRQSFMLSCRGCRPRSSCRP